jgi:hypothetical protein
MVGIVVVTRAALLIARRASTWTVAEHLNGRSPVCVAVDPGDPTRVYCGTARAGLFRSRDSGRHWEPVGPGIAHHAAGPQDIGEEATVGENLDFVPLPRGLRRALKNFPLPLFKLLSSPDCEVLEDGVDRISGSLRATG